MYRDSIANLLASLGFWKILDRYNTTRKDTWKAEIIPEDIERLTTPRDIPRPYRFNFSTKYDVGSPSRCFKFIVVFLFLLYCSIFPVVFFFAPKVTLWEDVEYAYGAFMYLLAFNVIVVLGFGYIIVGCIAYPYSSSIFSKTYKR